MRAWPVVSPPSKGWAEVAFEGQVGGFVRPKSGDRGLVRLAVSSESAGGIRNGADWGGTKAGRGGSLLGVGKGFLGASLRGSTCFR